VASLAIAAEALRWCCILSPSVLHNLAVCLHE